MKEYFLDRFWGKPLSIFILLIVLSFGAISCIPLKSSETESTDFTQLYVYICVASIAVLAYSIYVITSNSLPRCKKDKKGVLFVFKTATDNQYKEFKFSIEEKFKSVVAQSAVNIAPICLNANNLKQYDIYDLPYMKKLLIKTNCYFCIEFFVEADSINNPTNYTTTINTGVLHPNISEKSVNYLMKNLSFGMKNIRKFQFDTKNKTVALGATSDYLATLSEYVIGILLIMSNNILESINILNGLLQRINAEHPLYLMTKEGAYEACLHMLAALYEKYHQTNDIALLDEAERYLILSNDFEPGKYEYHLNMAYIAFYRDRNVNLAKSHIQECKKLNLDHRWKYSDAFLVAYESDNPNIVYGSYKSLCKYTYNIMDIISFIENVLEKEPAKAILHLALGVLYENINDQILSSCHFRRFLEQYTGTVALRKNTLNSVKKAIDLKYCKEKQESDDCSTCSLRLE